MRSTPRASHLGLRSAALALSILVPTATLPTTAAAAPVFGFAKSKKKKKKKAAPAEPDNRLTAQDAADARAPIQERAQGMAESDPGGAASLLADEARKLGDPILFIDAAEAYKAEAAKDRATEPAEASMEEARVALDILYFLQDPRADAKWEIVPEGEISSQIDRARGVLAESEALAAEIEREKAPPPPPESEGKRERTPAPKDGRGLIAVGSLLTVVGAGGLGMMGAGLAIGADAQKTVEDPTVTGDAFDEADARGKRANLITYAGIGVGAVGLIGGVTLLVLGVKKRKQYRADNADTALHVTPALGPGLAGLTLSGRF